MIRTIHTTKAPQAIGPYSQAIVANGFVFCSGQIALDPETGKLTGTTVKEQTKQIFSNLASVLVAADSSLAHVTQTTCYLRNMGDFAEFNEVYASYFSDHKPARVTVGVAELPKDALVEIAVIAVQP